MIPAPRITVDEVASRAARGESFAFADARNPTAWGEANRKLPGAIRVPADDIDDHVDELPEGRAIVAYCT